MDQIQSMLTTTVDVSRKPHFCSIETMPQLSFCELVAYQSVISSFIQVMFLNAFVVVFYTIVENL